MCGLPGHTYNECLVFFGKPVVTLSLFSSLQLDELELEDELEELELENLKGPLLLLLGWRDETLAFALGVANEKEMPEGGGLPLLI
jgi:hypothetical protein